MRRMFLSAAMTALAAMSPFAAAIAHAQFGSEADSFSSTGDAAASETIIRFSIYLYWLLVAAATIMIIMGAVGWFTAYANPEVAKKGVRRLLYGAALMGIAVVVRVLPTLF